MENEFYISLLIAGHLQEELNIQQQAELDAWLNASDENRAHFNECYNADQINSKLKHFNTADRETIWNKTKSRIDAARAISKSISVKRFNSFWYKIVAAASLFMITSVGLYFYISKISIQNQQTVDLNAIAPGKSKATLILANGSKIVLSEATKGELATESGVSISKTKDGQVVYTINSSASIAHSDGKVMYNTLYTAKGETYQIVLPDKSVVWLNAASSLKYPSSFLQTKSRQVELKGEAYFEVAKDKTHPFIVKTIKQEVEVLGTHFNINSYEDEPGTKTTLLEGSVRVNNTTTLKPGEQSIVNNNTIKVIRVNTENVTAWKNGDFVFKDEDFRTTMRKIARWYDVEFIYDPSVPANIELAGWVSRKSPLSIVLERIELASKLHFEIKGRRITVMK